MAGMIVKEDVERVRAAADLYDIVSATVTLKPSGTGTFVGLCPFHDEKTPSFSVRPSLGVWHCFGCGAGGDVFKYVEQKENIDFREAVELLADRYHIEVHYDKSQDAKDNSHAGSKRARLIEANEEAQRFFSSQINSKEAAPARSLLAGRNFTQAQCERFGCGYAPNGWDNLVRYLSNKGFTRQELLDAGLARQGQRGIYDYFRGRLTWPIRDSTGRTLGFGARRLYDDDSISAKYINTPDTVLYRKTQVLYGIDIAKSNIVKKRQVVIVEGYTDVMACHLAGVDTAVATCGTAFGAEHAKIIRRLIADDSLGAIQLVGPVKVEGQKVSSRIVFTFDGDAAGQKAALHAFGLDSAFLTQTFVAVADNNLDPCDLRIQRGDEAVRSLIARANPLYDFVIDTVIRRFDTSFATGQMGAVKAVAPLVAQIRDRSLLDLYTRKAVRNIGVDLDVMRKEVESNRRRLHVVDDDAYSKGYSSNVYADSRVFDQRSQSMNEAAVKTAMLRSAYKNQSYYKVDDSVFMCEQQFMAVLMQSPLAFSNQLFAHLTLNNFITPVFRTLFQAFVASGGLPSTNISQGLWLHTITKAAGPMLEGVINELSVMPLPLSFNKGLIGASSINSSAAYDSSGVSTNESPSDLLCIPSEEEQKYANELLIKLLDVGFMRKIGAIKLRMSKLEDGSEKLNLLGQITRLESARKDLQSQIL
ncbi:DNA primase [Gardnerella pickettii 00703Bmash]|uniref:DNA primase n=1 Tax=Gardnerella pickettii TaxID=2914924 RepID=UPI0002633F8F|nr:DNA primase [Gardnerella pickettii]EIK83871.1 DNA primase [Gardnerella pickettii 00703Bmash]RIY18890.1 DNA primase [Bifidobacteriaceae bacterium NR026]